MMMRMKKVMKKSRLFLLLLLLLLFCHGFSILFFFPISLRTSTLRNPLRSMDVVWIMRRESNPPSDIRGIFDGKKPLTNYPPILSRRKKEAREVHKKSAYAKKVHGLKAKLYHKTRHSEKVQMQKT